MAFEINDLKGIFVLVLFAIPMVASTNINCNGRAFHCVNSTHFMICVDLGGGLSTTIDDFVIPCPATTVCHENNVFECDFPEVTTPQLQVIGVYKQSDTSEPTSVTTSVTAPTPLGERFNVFKENITATTLSISEDVTQLVKLEVLENIKNPVGVYIDNTTEASLKVTSGFIDSTNEVSNDKQTSNTTITTSATDNKNHLESAVNTSIYKPLNNSSIDNPKSIDTATSGVGLINLISTELPRTVNTKPSYDVLTSLDTLYDKFVTTTEQYITKQVIIHGENVENITKKIIIPTEIIVSEKSTTTDEVSSTPVVNTHIKSDINNTIEFINTTDSRNQTIAEGNSLGKSNNASESETTTEYLALINMVNISEPVTADLSPQTTTKASFVPMGLVDLISAAPKQNAQSTHDYINTFYGNTVTTTTDQYTTKLETTTRDKPVTAKPIITTPIINTTVQNVFNNDINNDSLTELNSTAEINSNKNVPETNINYLIPEPTTIGSQQTTTESTFVSKTTETNIMYTTERTPKSEDLIKSESLKERHTTATQPLQIIITTHSPIEPTDNSYQINQETNQTMLSEKNISLSNLQTTTEKKIVPTTTEANIMYTTEGTPKSGDLIKNVSLVESHTTATKPLQIIITTHSPPTDNSYQINQETNQTVIKEKNNSLSTINTIERIENVSNASSLDMISNQVTESTLLPSTTTTKNAAIELTTAETSQNGVTGKEVKNELRATNAPTIINEFYVENVKNNTLSNNTINTTETVQAVFNALNTDIFNEQMTEPSIITYPTIDISTAEMLQNGSTSHSIEAKNELPATSGLMSVNEANVENVRINALVRGETTPAPYNVASDSVTNTTGKDFISKSDVVTNPQIGFTTEIIAHKPSGGSAFIDHGTTQKITTDPKTTIYGSLNQSEILGIVSLPENVNADHLTTTVVDKNLIGMTTANWNDIENSATTPFPSNDTGKTSLSNSVMSVNQDIISATKVGNTQDVLIKRILPEKPSKKYYASELASTTPITVQITTISIDMMNTSEQVSSNTPETVNIYRASTTVDKMYTSTTLPVDITHIRNIENVTDIAVTTNPPQKSTSQNIYTVNQLNSTTTETVSDLPLLDVTTAEYVVLNTTNLNTSSWKVSVNIDTEGTKVDPNAYVNNTETVKPITGKNIDNATSPSSAIKDENITIVSVSDMINSSVNAMLNETMQPTNSNPPLSNNYINTTESQGSSAYVTASATNNALAYNLVQARELVTQKNPEGISSAAQTNVKNSVLSTPSPNTLPITEINTEQVQDVGTEAALPSTVELKHVNSTKIAVQSENINEYNSSTEVPTKLNKPPKVETKSSVGSVMSVTFTTVATPGGFMTLTVYNEVTTIKDSAFISTQILPKVEIGTESAQYISEASLPTSELPVVQLTTEPTHTTDTSTQMIPSAAIAKTNQDVLTGIKTTDLPQNVLLAVNNNVPQSMSSLPIIGLTAAQMTTEPTDTSNGFAQGTPLIAVPGNTNQGVSSGIKTTDLPENVLSAVNNNVPQSMSSLPILGFIAAQMTTEPTDTSNGFAQTTPLSAAGGNTNQGVLSGLKTTDLPQYVTSTVSYNNTESVSDITTEIITDLITGPDSMVETIKVVGDKVSGSFHGETTLSDVMSNNPTVKVNAYYSVKSVKNMIDHESIVVATTSKNNEQNRPITSAKSVDINKAEIVNHTESNWMRPDVNIDTVKIKESSIEEEDSKSSVSDSSLISEIGTDDRTPVDKIEYRLTTVAKNLKETASGAPKNTTQSKTIITNENKNAEIDSKVKSSTEIIDVKKYQVQVESKNISDDNINNTIANITTSKHNLSVQKSTINDELEQHLISTNHTITTEVQSYLYESDKQSNKTSDELTLNGASMHNLNLTSIKLNASSKDTSAMNVSATDFNCSNHTRSKYADKKDCRKFFTCIGNLPPILGICPNSTVFSEINKQCTSNLSHCVRNNQFLCLSEGRFSDFFKDNIYYICVKNRLNGFIRYKLQCKDDYHLNKNSIKCEKNEDISTQSVSLVSETNNDESRPQPKSEKIISTDDFVCENEGKFPYDKDCSKYYECNKMKNVYYICVKNRMNGFTRYKLQCQGDYHLNKDTVKCEKNEEIYTQSASSVSETNSDESKPHTKLEKKFSTDDFECENEGKFPYAKDCNKYYVCTKIKDVYRRRIKKCASEEVFDKKKKKCVESDSGEC